MRPPGRNALRHASAAATGFAMNMRPKRDVTASNDASATPGMHSSSIARNSAFGKPAPRAAARAPSTIAGVRSRPTTRPAGPTTRAIVSGVPLGDARAGQQRIGYGARRSRDLVAIGEPTRRGRGPLRALPRADGVGIALLHR